MKRKDLTYDLLKEKGVGFELDANEQPIIHQTKWWKTNTNGKKWQEVRPQFLTKTNPAYYIVPLKLDDCVRPINQTVQDIVYILSHPDASLELLDVDHIDNNSLNNNPQNLQLITRSENIKKRPNNGANQYMYNHSEEEGVELIKKNKEHRTKAALRKELKKVYRTLDEQIGGRKWLQANHPEAV